MAMSHTLIRFALGVSLSAFAQQAAAQTSAVVAEVNGRTLTRADLEQKQAAKLLQARQALYQVEREALDQLVDQELLEMEAAREHVTVDTLLQRHVISQVKEPSVEQLEVFYEGLRTEEPFATAREKIVATIRQIRLARARAAYLQSLRRNATIRIALAPPDVEGALDDASGDRARTVPVRVVEFADYECPYCRAVHPTIKRLQQEFGDRIAFTFRDFPLPVHTNARKTAEAARCAGAQGKFSEFHDLLFGNSGKFEIARLKEYARTLRLDGERFDRCLDSNEQAARVQNDMNEAQRLGLTGTPSFFINGHYLSGAVKYETLREVVEQNLRSSATESTRK